jgi:N-formylmaleamate deformylase
LSGWSTGNCAANGINIHYTRTGGSKPPVILLHGLTANGACWTAVARALEAEYDVLMPDARGHGGSSAPDYGYHYEDHAADVVGLIETLRLAPAVLIGHSMGGMTAALVASRYPGLVRGLILADPSFLSPKVQREVRASHVLDQHRRYLKMGLDELTAEARLKHPERSLDTIERIARARLQTSVGAFDVLSLLNFDYRQVVSTIEIFSLLVIGGPAGVVSPGVAAELQRLNPRLQTAQIPEAEHGMHYDQPEKFADIVKSFLSAELHRESPRNIT